MPNSFVTLCLWNSPARILEWVAIPFSKGSSQPGDQTWVSCVAGRFFTDWATEKPFISQLQVFSRVKDHICCRMYVFKNDLKCVKQRLHYYQLAVFFNVSLVRFLSVVLQPHFPMNFVVFIVQFCIVQWILGMHMLYDSSAVCIMR